jgi:hypothetical protein
MTDLAATELNRTAAMRLEAKVRELVISGRANELLVKVVPFSEAAEAFLNWADREHREHPNSAKRLRTSRSSISKTRSSIRRSTTSGG